MGNPVPINAMFDGDFVTQLVMVEDTDTMLQVAEKVAHHVVGRRVAARNAPMHVRYDGLRVSEGKTVLEAGIGYLHNVYVGYDEKEAA